MDSSSSAAEDAVVDQGSSSGSGKTLRGGFGCDDDDGADGLVGRRDVDTAGSVGPFRWRGAEGPIRATNPGLFDNVRCAGE